MGEADLKTATSQTPAALAWEYPVFRHQQVLSIPRGLPSRCPSPRPHFSPGHGLRGAVAPTG